MIYRQGDVLLKKTNKKVTKRHKPVPRENGRVVLAHGELTGHSHAIDDAVAKLFEAGSDRLLTAKKAVTLKHEEHDPIKLPAGNYEVITQREYDPDDGSIRVAD